MGGEMSLFYVISDPYPHPQDPGRLLSSGFVL